MRLNRDGAVTSRCDVLGSVLHVGDMVFLPSNVSSHVWSTFPASGFGVVVGECDKPNWCAEDDGNWVLVALVVTEFNRSGLLGDVSVHDWGGGLVLESGCVKVPGAGVLLVEGMANMSVDVTAGVVSGRFAVSKGSSFAPGDMMFMGRDSSTTVAESPVLPEDVFDGQPEGAVFDRFGHRFEAGDVVCYDTVNWWAGCGLMVVAGTDAVEGTVDARGVVPGSAGQWLRNEDLVAVKPKIR